MTTSEHAQLPRMLTPAELAFCIKLFREIRQWSQEQLSDISGLSNRTVQRVEEGKASSTDTRRALARAFEFEDIDAFNKPFSIPDEQEQKAQQEQFAKDHITLKALHLKTGKELAKLAEVTMIDLFSQAVELPRQADEHFAAIVDYYHDYRDVKDEFAESDKFDIYDTFDVHIQALRTMNFSLCYATRKVAFNSEPGQKPWVAEALYVVACQRGKEIEQFAVPKIMRLG